MQRHTSSCVSMRCVLLLPLLLAASPHAQTLGASGPPRAIEEPGKRYIATGAQATGALAGEPGESLTRLEGRPNEFLYALEFGERADEPCYVKAFWADASSGRNRLRTRISEFNGCEGVAGSRKYIGAQTSLVEGTSETPRGIYELRIRTNARRGTNLKLKAAFVEHGQLPYRYFTDDDGFARPNARRRTQEESRCTLGQSFVTALEIHHNSVAPGTFSSGNRVYREAITGMAVRCRTFHAVD
ncbi:MAG TPA: hypothetical protein EYG39_13295 [Rhodothermales bacterium]|nr:hypothetical protein [Rhodothermales bacterium]